MHTWSVSIRVAIPRKSRKLVTKAELCEPVEMHSALYVGFLFGPAAAGSGSRHREPKRGFSAMPQESRAPGLSQTRDTTVEEEEAVSLILFHRRAEGRICLAGPKCLRHAL